MSVATFTKSGTKATAPAKLDKTVFGVEVANHELLKLAYTAYLANGRDNLAVVKTRGLVSGGGKKPWKQKGTGRARFGSSRNPIWRGGGIVFGPTGNENYTKELNVKAKRQAIRQALTLAAESNKFIVVETIVAKDGKTAELAKLLAKVGAIKNTLVVVENKTPELIRATGNLVNTKLVTASYLNVFDVLNADSIVVSNDALATITTWLATEAKKEAK
ncbi:MAG: 50S ribosomal protein L4 [Candidatus Saccharimonadales bacterium]